VVRRLDALYDGRCYECRRILHRLTAERPLASWVVHEAHSPAGRRLDPRPPPEDPKRHLDLLVVSDHGEVWSGINAWRMCLWALRRHRAYSLVGLHFRPADWLGPHPPRGRPWRDEDVASAGSLLWTWLLVPLLLVPILLHREMVALLGFLLLAILIGLAARLLFAVVRPR
jgi:hypothetical protein